MDSNTAGVVHKADNALQQNRGASTCVRKLHVLGGNHLHQDRKLMKSMKMTMISCGRSPFVFSVHVGAMLEDEQDDVRPIVTGR